MTITPEEMQQQEKDAMFADYYVLAEETLLSMWMCSDCGAMVRNTSIHYLWHKKLEGNL